MTHLLDQIDMNPATKETIKEWLEGDYDEETKESIRNLLKNNPQELVDAFYTHLSFGTGGMRGVMGPGPNRLNCYTIRASSQGLANYLHKHPPLGEKHSVFIGYDSRHNSSLFAEEAAKVLAANGIHAFLCKKLRPTPYVSFGCRYKQCSSAIMITASHNPSEYNGYKVYWSDGGQVLPPHDLGIIEEVKKIKSLPQVKRVDNSNHPLIEYVESQVDEAYFQAIEKLPLYPEENKKYGSSLHIIYTSLHGTGITLLPEALRRWGFTNFSLVEEQKEPDGDFPTVTLPNPEEKSALALGLQQMEETNGDILLASDPDADRVGLAVRHHGENHLLTGNQIASIMLAHICCALTEKKRMPKNPAVVKTIGTTELFQAIADSYKIPCFNVLTGFKYIAEKIHEWEEDPKGYQYLFGGEESFGYLFGTYSRDKDAIISSLILAEVALSAKKQGKTLVDLLHSLYKQFGVFHEELLSLKFPESKAGKEEMQKR